MQVLHQNIGLDLYIFKTFLFLFFLSMLLYFCKDTLKHSMETANDKYGNEVWASRSTPTVIYECIFITSSL